MDIWNWPTESGLILALRELNLGCGNLVLCEKGQREFEIAEPILSPRESRQNISKRKSKSRNEN